MSSYYHQNLTGGDYPLWRYGRAWWGSLTWGWLVFWPTSLLMLGICRHGFCCYLRWFGFYLSWTRSEEEHGRWEVAWSNGCLRLEHPWVRDDWYRSCPWWKKAIRLPIVDWLIGSARFTRESGSPSVVFIPLPEGCYRATCTPEVLTWRRRWYWPVRHRKSVSLDIPGGIPFSGKGENSWDCGDDGMFGCGGDTVEDAIGGAVASVLRSRRRYGHDSKGTGIVPAIVRNAEKEAR